MENHHLAYNAWGYSMGLFKKRNFYLLLIITAILGSLIGYFYFLKNTKEQMLDSYYKATAQELQKRVDHLIANKQKATLALAITLAKRDDKLAEYIKQKSFPSRYFSDLIAAYKKSTHYKNIWIQVIDAKGISLCRSWAQLHGDNLSRVRRDISTMMQQHQSMTTISIGRFTLSIKAMAPVFDKGRFIGTIEIMSHFNSIAKVLKKEGWKSVVLAGKRYKKQLTHPFTKTFIKDYYVANLGVKQKLLEYLLHKGMKRYFKNHYESDQYNFIVSHPLLYHKKLLGTYILIKPLDMIQTADIEGFVFRWLVFGVIIFMVLAGVVNIYLYIILHKQKNYYKKIIDSSNNIVLVNDKKSIVDANKTFFEYFSKYKTLEAFKMENSCICNFFVREDGYLDRGDTTYHWIDTIIEHPKANHKVKIKINEKIYYFAVNASLISQEKNHYSIIFSDITKEELYKNELETLSIKDALTDVYNRRYYENQIEKEMHSAKRYHYDLSLIMFDIDFFKKINDAHGHSVGDKVLIHLSKSISSSLREGDSLCRIGGEEFMIILPHTKKEDAIKIAEKLRVMVANDREILPITISIGVTQYVSGEAEKYLYARVDKALYSAKENGRNQVIIA